MADPRYKNGAFQGNPGELYKISPQTKPQTYGWSFDKIHCVLKVNVYELGKFRMAYLPGRGWGVQDSSLNDGLTFWYPLPLEEITSILLGSMSYKELHKIDNDASNDELSKRSLASALGSQQPKALIGSLPLQWRGN